MRDIELMIALGAAQRAKPLPKKQKIGGHGHAAGVGAQGKCGKAPKIKTGDVDGVWQPPVHKCIATRGDGVADLVAGMEAHHRWLTTTKPGAERRRRRLSEAMRNQLRNTMIEQADIEMGRSHRCGGGTCGQATESILTPRPRS